MNTIWSQCVQGLGTLYLSRRLRFSDRFRSEFMKAFALDERASWRMLEVGCGPGALAQALLNWYPQAEVIGLDRDSEFVRFAARHVPGATFLEGDAASLSFAENTFDVTISNTVSEHIEPSAFFGEQLRVLKPGGVCLVLSTRKTICQKAKGMEQSALEKEVWERTKDIDLFHEYQICQYPFNEAELPARMAEYGFHHISIHYVAVDLTPDDASIDEQMARDIIYADRQNDLDAVDQLPNFAPECSTEEERTEMKRAIHQRYDRRLRQYERGEKQWDTTVTLIMVVRGEKAVK